MADINTLRTLDNAKLIDVVKNYKQYGYDTETRQFAISILEERGISTLDLKMTGNFENQNFERANMYYNSFFRYSNLALISYCLIFILNFLPVFIPKESTTILTILMVSSWVSLLIYFIFIIKALIDHNNLYKLIGNKHKTNGVIMYYMLGAPLYLIFYFVFKNQVYNEMSTIK